MQNISPIKKRILQYIENKRITMRKFSVMSGISRGTLESKTGITEETLAKFLAVFPDIPLDWLILGKENKHNLSLINEPQPKYGNGIADVLKEIADIKKRLTEIESKLSTK